LNKPKTHYQHDYFLPIIAGLAFHPPPMRADNVPQKTEKRFVPPFLFGQALKKNASQVNFEPCFFACLSLFFNLF